MVMARRRGAAGGGWAGEDGDLFLITDGVHPVWDTQAAEVYPDVEQARRAWPSVRRSTWEHEDREEVFPPAGAVYDGLVSHVQACGFRSRTMRELGNAALLDLAAVDRFRRDQPRAAAEIAEHLDAYRAAVRRLLELGKVPTPQQWGALFDRRVSRGSA